MRSLLGEQCLGSASGPGLHAHTGIVCGLFAEGRTSFEVSVPSRVSMETASGVLGLGGNGTFHGHLCRLTGGGPPLPFPQRRGTCRIVLRWAAQSGIRR